MFIGVAEEVRALAQRSANAARETADKVEIALHKSNEGASTSVEVEGMLTQIVQQVREMDTLVAEIATACGEQSQGIAQVTKAMAEMDQVTQENAAGAEESASAAHELSAQSSELRTSVDQLNAFTGVAAPTASASKVAVVATKPLGSPRQPKKFQTVGQKDIAEVSGKSEDRFFN